MILETQSTKKQAEGSDDKLTGMKVKERTKHSWNKKNRDGKTNGEICTDITKFEDYERRDTWRGKYKKKNRK